LAKFDALIVGGGPAGAAAAQLLARAGWSVALAEKSEFPRRKVCGEYLSPTNYALFRRLGILEEFRALAGPEVRRVELVVKETTVSAGMPRLEGGLGEWGRALGRDTLDALLVERARAAGAEVWQPWSAVDVRRDGPRFVTRLASKTKETAEVESTFVVSAHGSWGVGPLPTQARRQTPDASDLFAFKTHFRDAALPPDVMNMLVFPGGYAGMVNTDGRLLSYSFCLRRDRLEEVRRGTDARHPADSAQDYILRACPAVSRLLGGATREGAWLSTGPLRPGFRRRYEGGIFSVGNSAGEAHPTIADGISMALQSAWLLARRLGERRGPPPPRELDAAGRLYDRDWRRAFRLRILAAELFARLSLKRRNHLLLLPAVRAFPSLLTLGARLGGIVDNVVEEH
jgi:menaquinone-9 beta-reductase